MPARECAADVLRVPLALAVVDDLHRVLAGEIGLGLAGLGVDGVDPEIGRDVAVEQVELEVDQDRLLRPSPRTETSRGPTFPSLVFSR